MQIQSINNKTNSTNFGAKILLEGTKVKKLLNYNNKQYAGEILDKFEKFHPNEVVEIGVVQYPVVGAKIGLYARNYTTGESELQPIFPEKYEQAGEIEKCGDFYGFLSYLLNQKPYSTFHNFSRFWGKEPKKFYPADFDLTKHSAFIH